MKIEYSSNNKVCYENSAYMDYDVAGELEEGFLRLRRSDATTPLRKHLPKRLFHVLQYKTTPLGATLLDVVRLGLLRHDSPTGAVLPDHLAYDTFKLLLDPILEERHLGFDPSADSQPPVDWGDWRRLHNLDPQEKFIKRVCVSASRNLDGVRFTPTMSPVELQSVENAVLLSLYKLPGEYAGDYDYIQCMTRARKEKLFQAGCLFNCGDKYDHAANVPRFWSYGRGVFVNDEFTFVVWVNAKDHVRVLSMEEGGKVQKAYRRLSQVMPFLDCRLHPARHPRLGQLTVSLDDVGSGVSADAVVSLRAMPHPLLEDVAKVYYLEMCFLEEDLYMVSNRSHLGLTEFEIIKRFSHGLRELLYLASFLERSMPKDSDDEDEESEDAAGEGKKGEDKESGDKKGKDERGKKKRGEDDESDDEESKDKEGKGEGGKKKRDKNKGREDEETGDKEGKGKGGKNKRGKNKRGDDKESEDEESGDKEGKGKGGKHKRGKNKRDEDNESEDEERGDKEGKGKGGKHKRGKNKRGEDNESEDEETGDKEGKGKGGKNKRGRNKRGEDKESEVGEEGEHSEEDSGNEGDDETSEVGNARNETKKG